MGNIVTPEDTQIQTLISEKSTSPKRTKALIIGDSIMKAINK
jgi:hypothetical protein